MYLLLQVRRLPSFHIILPATGTFPSPSSFFFLQTPPAAAFALGFPHSLTPLLLFLHPFPPPFHLRCSFSLSVQHQINFTSINAKYFLLISQDTKGCLTFFCLHKAIVMEKPLFLSVCSYRSVFDFMLQAMAGDQTVMQCQDERSIIIITVLDLDASNKFFM